MSPVRVSYATCPHPDETRSTMAVAVGDDVTVSTARGRGLNLEATALIRALVAAKDTAAPVEHVQVTPALHAALTGPGPVSPRLESKLVNIRRLLTAFPRTLHVAEEPQALRRQLADAAGPVDLGVHPGDRHWVETTGATVVYTDAASETEEYLGTWAWYVDEDRHAAGPIPHLTTSHAAERYAAAQALAAIDGPVLLVTDAWDLTASWDAYLSAQGVTSTLNDQVAARGENLRVSYVKGHDSCLGNLAADQLAGDALAELLTQVRSDKARHAEHRRARQQLLDATADYRARQKVKNDWFHQRAGEIIAAEYPNWRDLTAQQRTFLGRMMTLRMREEYAAAHPTATGPSED